MNEIVEDLNPFRAEIVFPNALHDARTDIRSMVVEAPVNCTIVIFNSLRDFCATVTHVMPVIFAVVDKNAVSKEVMVSFNVDVIDIDRLSASAFSRGVDRQNGGSSDLWCVI